MSLISIYYFLLLLLKVLNSNLDDNDPYISEFKTLCKNNFSNSDNSIFKDLVKKHFESFLCKIFFEIFENNEDKFYKISDVKNMDICFNKIINSFKKESKFYEQYFSLSGSRINKIGDEQKCKKSNNSYFLIEMDASKKEIRNNLTKLLENTDNYTETNHFYQYLELNGFLDNDKFYLGLCLWQDCTEFFQNFFDDAINPLLLQYLKKKGYTAKSWKSIPKKDKVNKSKFNIPIIIPFIFISFVIFIRFIVYISNYCTNKNQHKEPKYFKLNPLSPSPEEIQLAEQNFENEYDSNNDDITDQKIDNNNNTAEDKNKEIKENNGNIDNNISQVSNSDIDTKVSRFSSIMTHNRKTQAETFLEYYEYIAIDNLYRLETKSYNTKNLEVICGFRFFLLLFMSFYYVYSIFYIVKWNNAGTLSFYQDITHIVLAKLSKMSFRVWIFFDGFQWCFKLLSYLKKLKSNTVSFKHILIFNINIIEKIIVFIIIFLLFIYQFDNLGQLLKTSEFLLHSEKYTTKVKCYQNPLYILVLPILGYGENIGEYKKCYTFAYILMNELYSIIICSFLFFLFFKCQSKFLEYSFLFLFFISIIILFIYFQEVYFSEDNFYYQKYVLGEDLSLKSIGLFFHYFFIGSISGLIYYYSTLMNIYLEKYNIFESCYKLMYCMTSMNPILRHFLGFLCLFLIMLICSYYPLLFKLGLVKTHRLVIKVDFFTYIVFSYENIIQIFLFMFFFFDTILSSELFTKIFLSNDIFIIFERSSFIFFIIIEEIVFLFETVTYLDGMYWNTENIIFISIICFLINIIISYVFSFLIQLPVRLYIKNKARVALENYEQDYKFKSL